MLQTVKAQKVDEEFGVTCLVSMFSFHCTPSENGVVYWGLRHFS